MAGGHRVAPFFFFFLNDPAPTEISPFPLHDALPTPAAEISRCVEACLRHKRPVYIEVPHDMVDREIPTVQIPESLKTPSDPAVLKEALGESLAMLDRKSTRLNSSHLVISYAVFCLKK